MLEEHKDNTKTINNEKKEIQKSRWKRTLNIVQKLYLREITHDVRHTKALSKIPPIMTYRLRDLVCDTILDAGHVFLGFTKDGKFVISYSLQVEADTTIPIYIYKLHWWRFVPQRPLRQISEIRLFGEQEIWQDLYIAVCQWPSDDMKVVVYGYCLQEPRDQQLKECYITITAIPDVENCPYCDLNSTGSDELLCIKHCFTIHTKYHLVSPFPKFLPHICLKIDGVVVINTGDSLVSLSTKLLVDDQSTTATNHFNFSSNFTVSDETTFEYAKSLGDRTVPEQTKQPSDTNCSYSEKTSHLQNHPKWPGTNNIDSLKQNSQQELYLRTDNKTDKPSVDLETGAHLCDENELPTGSDSLGQASTSCPWTCENNQLTNQQTNSGNGNVCNNLSQDQLSLSACDESTKENISPQHRCIVSDCYDYFWVLETKKAVDWVSSLRNSFIENGQQSCVNSLKQIYVEGDRNLRDEEDCVNVNPVYFLPVDVHGSGYIRLSCMSENPCRMITPCIVVKQNTFDVEQFVHEVAQRMCSNSGKKYLAVNDYDIQIVDVAPESEEAVVLAIMLIKAALVSPHKSEARNSNYTNNMCGKVYQAELVFVWNLISGIYSIVGAQELIELTKPNQYTQYWNPGLQKCQKLQQRMAIPQIDTKSVKVMSNNAVLKGRTLSMLFEPNQHVALVL